MGKNVIIFGVSMSSSVHIDNKNKDIVILGEGTKEGLDDITLTLESKYSINFTQFYTKLIPHYNGTNIFLFVNATKIYPFKAKASEIKDYTQCLGYISKDFTINNMKKTGSVNFFSVDFNLIDINNILDTIYI